MRNLLIALFVVASAVLYADGPTPPPAAPEATKGVSISAKGDDVRGVLTDLFRQANKNFVLQPGINFALFLNLNDLPFDEALAIITTTASLRFEVQNDIYFIAKARPATVPPKTVTAARTEPTTETQTAPRTATPAAPSAGRLPEDVLKRRVTTRLKVTDLRVVLANLSVQTDVAIEIDGNVPAFRIDAFLIDTSLKFALDQITAAAGIRYRFTDNRSIRIFRDAPKPETSRVTLSTGKN